MLEELKPGITRIYCLPEWHYGSDTVHCADNYNPINISRKIQMMICTTKLVASHAPKSFRAQARRVG